MTLVLLGYVVYTTMLFRRFVKNSDRVATAFEGALSVLKMWIGSGGSYREPPSPSGA